RPRVQVGKHRESSCPVTVAPDIKILDLADSERPAAGDVPARHVLEAYDRARRLLRAARGHPGGRAAPRPDAAGGGGPGPQGGWLAVTHTYPSEMAQNFWAAIYAWVTGFAVTILVSLLTRPRPDGELVGLVYSLTPRPAE